ncbi:NMCC_0638 family (lipo)protein [Oxalicibacterium faecigallinarum]|uniref:Uncharacterized protein n=1 Tax=Oxalicibacterium faecigallinarum TaxID=573741 RepID=A0A8J3AUC2_9BURK|nr:hypothetical protein [Oxalicibacterium faecigallinarum]GGI16278.1 hypothetical protein GCM10008066_03160 [Oxalicibacterium faecigallinarum]
MIKNLNSWLINMRFLIGFFSLLLVVAVPAFAQTTQAEQQGNFVLRVYMDTCVKHLGNTDKISRYVKENKYVRADEQFSKAALRGQKGEVWGVPNSIGQFIVVLSGENHCSAWARTADAKTVNTGFERLVKGTARPGITISSLVDKVSDGVGGKYRQLGYFLSKEGASHGWTMLSTTSDAPAAEVQTRLTFAPTTLP